MASRRDLLDHRPASRSTTRRSFGSALRAQLPQPEKEHPDEDERPETRKRALLDATPPSKSVAQRSDHSLATKSPKHSIASLQNRDGIVRRRVIESSEEEEESKEDEEAVNPKRMRASLGEEERLVRERDAEYVVRA